MCKHKAHSNIWAVTHDAIIALSQQLKRPKAVVAYGLECPLRILLMKRAIRRALTVALLLNLSFFSAAESAKSLYNKGKIAEARQNYEQAYELYKQAYDQKPQDVSYRAAYERLRFLAGASHVHRGQLLREAGRLEEALAEFQKATEIDPASAIAKQERQVTRQMIDAAAKGG